MYVEEDRVLKNTSKKSENIILALYFIVLICNILSYSTAYFIHNVQVIRLIGIVLVFSCSILLQKHTLRQWKMLLILSSVCMLSYVFYKVNIDFLYITLLMFGMSNISARKLLSLSAKTIFYVILFLTVCASIHLIPNLVFYRDGIMRRSWGTIYPLTYAGFIFFGCASWAATNKNNLKTIFSLVIIAIYVFVVSGARNDTIGIVLLIFACLSDYFPYRINKYLSLVSTLIIYSMCLLSIFVSTFLPYYSNGYAFLNKLFNGRLGLQQMLISSYHPTLLGQVIQQVGLGGATTTISNYFYIDNSYLRLLFMNGIILTFLFLYLVSYQIFYLHKMHLYKLIYIILILMISGITEDSLVNGVINVFFYILLSSPENLKNSFEIHK